MISEGGDHEHGIAMGGNSRCAKTAFYTRMFVTIIAHTLIGSK